jgi:cardiolipin synthase
VLGAGLTIFGFHPASLAVENPCLPFLTQVLSSSSHSLTKSPIQTLKDDPKLQADALELLILLPFIQSGKIPVRDPYVLDLVSRLGSQLQDTGKLPDILKAVAEQAKAMGKLPPQITPENLDTMIAMGSNAIDAELSARGMTRLSTGAKYEEWNALGNRLTSEIQEAIRRTLIKNPGKSGFEDPEFIRIFEQQTGTRFRQGNEIRLLINGPASFAERTRLIANARKSIHVASWAFYDDVTGFSFSDQLIKKAAEGVDVRVMVDGQIALHPGHLQTLKKMEDNGVQVVRWRSTDPLRRFDGQHRKFIIFDDQEVVGGGMNFGDVYSHMGAENTPKWRDTDVYIKGPLALDAKRLFAKLWNGQNTGSKVPLPGSIGFDAVSNPSKIALVNHQPGQGENIYRANLLAIEGASRTIDIENAYFILDPATYKALLRAKTRGVRVRILTNSAQSVDEPIVSYPIMASVNRLARQNFEVYVKEGTQTLHTKAMTVDGLYSWVGSHNFHPRSFRYEGEITMNVLDADFARKVRNMIQDDLNRAIRIKEPVELPKNLATDAVGFYFYDQL